MLRIGDVTIALRVGQLACLDLRMTAPDRERTIARGTCAEDVEEHQRGQPLTRRRTFPHARAAIAGRDRVGIVAAMAREILARKEAAFGPQAADDIFGDPAAIERVGAIAGDRPQGARQSWEGDPVTSTRW